MPDEEIAALIERADALMARLDAGERVPASELADAIDDLVAAVVVLSRPRVTH